MNNKYKLSDLKSQLGGDIDLFICAASFEDRCCSIPKAIRDQKVNVKKCLVSVCGGSKNERYLKNTGELRSFFPEQVCLIVKTNNDYPFSICDEWLVEIQKACKGFSGGEKIVFDITTFTHESLLIIINCMKSVSDDLIRNCVFLYSSAQDYSSKSNEIDKKWLSKGLKSIRTILGYPGYLKPMKKNHLIVLVGFEYIRALGLIEAFEPSYLSLGCGSKAASIDIKHREANKRFHSLTKSLQVTSPEVKSFEFECNDPDSTRNALKRIFNANPDMNYIIAPMNTKLSTIGCALFAWENDNVQLIYAQPEEYNYDDYSTPGSEFYCIKVEL